MQQSADRDPTPIPAGDRRDGGRVGEDEPRRPGGFGAVYKVSRAGKFYALKTESATEHIKVLKMEVYVMRLANQRKFRHFCTCEDSGAFGSVLYVVMTMDHRKALPGQKFSIGCALSTSRKDDVESWLYQQIEITRGALPWRSTENRDQVAMYKERCRFDVGLRELMGGCPREYIEILRYVDSLRYYDTPDYKRIYGLLKRAATTLGVSSNLPYDWELRTGAPSTPAK
ncbi:CK1/WORM6 protein kinase [Aphelenchoides fujianensis]|nr:CK1/WORM6 protein kinase [Aphelenchoides fujianensis]